MLLLSYNNKKVVDNMKLSEISSKDVIDDEFRFGIEINEYRAFDEIYKFLREEFDNSNLHEIVADIIDSAKSISPNYVYACELIQWVENNLEDWCKERNINYDEFLMKNKK